MNKIYVIILVLQLSSWDSLFSQSYISLKETKHHHPDSIMYLRISRKKLQSFPSEIWKYRKLKGLDLSKNKLSSISDSICLLTDLEELNLSKNKLTDFPLQLLACNRLLKLNLSSNYIRVIPNDVSKCYELREFDLYNNPIEDIGSGLSMLKNLVELDLRGLMMNKNKQKEILEKLPDVHVRFDAPCNCID